MERLLWGLLPHWARDPRMGRMTYNARSETAPGKPSFRDAWRHRRCLVPVTGWYEWQDGRLPSGRITKTRYLISRADHALFFLGGLWESNGQVARDETLSFSIVTLRATPFVAEIHNADPLDPRMPLIVPRAFQERWLDPELADPAQVSSLVAACGEAVRGLEEEALAAVPRPREKPPSAQGSLIDY
jgi:putative SOS response-associated peptidase YedK